MTGWLASDSKLMYIIQGSLKELFIQKDEL